MPKTFFCLHGYYVLVLAFLLLLLRSLALRCT